MGEKKKGVTLLAFGDSNTWGYNAKTGGRYPKEVRWTGVLEKLCPQVTVLEEGLCGRTTVFGPGFLRGKDALETWIGGNRRAGACVIMLGTNDCKSEYGADAESIASGLETCLDLLERKFPKEKILVVSPILLGDGVWCEGKDPDFDAVSVKTCARLAAAYRTVCERRGHPFFAAQDYVSAAMTDEEHLDGAGHAAFARVLAEKLREYHMI